MTQVDVDDVNVMYWDYYGDDIEHYRKQLRERLAVTSNTMFAGGDGDGSGMFLIIRKR